MKTVLIAAAAALALSSGAALAGGDGAIAHNTTTSMGSPVGSPGYAAARSEVVPGLPAQARKAEEGNEAKSAVMAYSSRGQDEADARVPVIR